MRLIIVFLCLCGFVTKSQNYFAVVDNKSFEKHKTERYIFNSELVKKNINNSYVFKFKSPRKFTSFAIGWKTDAKFNKHDLKIEYSVHKPKFGWTQTQQTHAYYSPQDSFLNMYLTDLLFGQDEFTHDSIKFSIYSDKSIDITELQLILMDLSDQVNSLDFEYKNIKNDDCLVIPQIIDRSQWCGEYEDCHNANYQITEIEPSHVVIHHGGAPNTYDDGAAIVRAYWNYHVNTLEWWDIGYNYLFDKYGNFFQGRINPNLPISDVKAAHAGASNSFSIGVNFLGNSDVTNPTVEQKYNCAKFLAWWFDNYQYSPLESENILCQDEIDRNMPRICGHRDVNPGGTICPGDALYSELDNLRSLTNNIIDSCSSIVSLKGFGNETIVDIYPNPAKSEIYINSEKSEEKLYYYLYTLDGKLLKSDKIESNATTILNLPKGLYLIKIIDSYKTVSQRIVIY